MSKRAAVLMTLALVATGCPRSRVTPAPSPTGTPRPPSLEVLAQNFRVPAGREGAVRFSIQPAEPSVRVILTFPDTGAIVSACALPSIDAPIGDTDAPACRSELPSGVRENLVNPAGAGAVALWVERGSAVTASLRLEYAEAGRRIAVRLPLLPAPENPSACKDNACNPFFEIRPLRGGAFQATASWTGGTARLALLEGRVLARAFSATGVPYAIAAVHEGRSPATIETRLSAPAEYALVLDGNREHLTAVTIQAAWP